MGAAFAVAASGWAGRAGLDAVGASHPVSVTWSACGIAGRFLCADVIVRSRLLEESHAELLLRLRQIEIDTAILRANGDTSTLTMAIPLRAGLEIDV